MFPFTRQEKKKLHILVVDDEQDFLCSMETWFTSQGYEVQAVSSGEAALETLKKMTPNVIFLDVSMPGLNGLQTLEQIRKTKPRVPVVILTAHGDEDLRLQAYKFGANAFLEKSLDFYKVEHVINSLVRVVSKAKK
jgi:two-component system nitrogen regulation response regulator NtrX